jgi:hypothetical protein
MLAYALLRQILALIPTAAKTNTRAASSSAPLIVVGQGRDGSELATAGIAHTSIRRASTVF